MELTGKISYKIKIISLEPEIKMNETFRKAVVDAAFRNGNGGAYRLVFDENTKQFIKVKMQINIEL